jgi:L-glyceraldehyde 3-phosphate reductase
MAKELASASPESNIRRQVERARALNDIAIARGQTLAQMSLAWVLRLQSVASALIGASSAAQVEENVGTLKKLEFTADELAQIDAITIPSPRY